MQNVKLSALSIMQTISHNYNGILRYPVPYKSQEKEIEKNRFYIHHLFYGPTGYQLSMFYRAVYTSRNTNVSIHSDYRGDFRQGLNSEVVTSQLDSLFSSCPYTKVNESQMAASIYCMMLSDQPMGTYSSILSSSMSIHVTHAYMNIV